MKDLALARLGMIMEPQAGESNEVEGVLNPAAARAKDGQLYLFPRLVARGNYSRIGIARVKFDRNGDPKEVERMGVVLEPEADYEISETGGGCEDPRISFVEPLNHYVMSYTALSRRGPRIAFAISDDLLHWRRIGLATFHPFHGVGFDGIDNKDASTFPSLIPGPLDQQVIGLIHRPLFPGTRPEEKATHKHRSNLIDAHRESIWISYCHVDAKNDSNRLSEFVAHHPLARPLAPWERLKIGGGTPPVKCRHGWLLVYHGVHDSSPTGMARPKLFYEAGVMVLAGSRPTRIVYRSQQAALVPRGSLERIGTVDDVVFPTGIDRRNDIGAPDRYDIYYGMADNRIGVARLDIPAKLPRNASYG